MFNEIKLETLKALITKKTSFKICETATGFLTETSIKVSGIVIAPVEGHKVKMLKIFTS